MNMTEKEMKIKYQGHPHLLTLFPKLVIKKLRPCFALRCVQCIFNLHFASLALSLIQRFLNPTEMEIEYFSHKHPLNLDELKLDRWGYQCCVCREPVSVIGTECYSCSECKEVMIHKLCGELEEEIQHPFHPLHPLILRSRSPYISNEFICNACERSNSGFVYHCAECQFDLDIKCASLMPTFSYVGHHHLLTLFETNFERKESQRCVCCDTHCYNYFFRCVECNYNIHKSCAADLPKHIQHPFHPPHPLTRVDDDPDGFFCNGCIYHFNTAYFGCAKCSFIFCENCYLLVPTIKYQGHPHLLTLFPKLNFPLECESCDKSLWKHSFLLRCVECKFNLHFQCHPIFPHTIKHSCHIDPLILTESPLKEEEGHEEFYCDACEKQRNPLDPVFYCAECEFVAEIGCVMDEILPSLSVENPPKIVEISAQQDVPSDELVQGDSNTQIDESVEKESTTAATKMLEVKFTKDPTSLVELDEEIAKINLEITALTTRRDVLQGKRQQFEGSTPKEYKESTTSTCVCET